MWKTRADRGELSDLPAWVFHQTAVGGISFTGKFGVASYPQQDREGPGIFLTSASCSTSRQAIDFSGIKRPYQEFWGGVAEFLGGLSGVLGREFRC
jgi:hypothetical protein